jgi:hypothetical protein
MQIESVVQKKPALLMFKRYRQDIGEEMLREDKLHSDIVYQYVQHIQENR